MSSTLTAPMFWMLAILFGVLLAVFAVFAFSSTGVGGATVSTGAVSTGNTLIGLLPWAAVLVTCGIVLVAIGGGRRG